MKKRTVTKKDGTVTQFDKDGKIVGNLPAPVSPPEVAQVKGQVALPSVHPYATHAHANVSGEVVPSSSGDVVPSAWDDMVTLTENTPTRTAREGNSEENPTSSQFLTWGTPERVHLHEVVPPDVLSDMCEGGYVSVSQHPRYGYELYSYTRKAMWDNVWNEATISCRGLVVDESGHIVARPFPKFFNHTQPEAPTIHWDERVIVADKVDGSLGILLPTPDGGHIVTTRGSWQSEQGYEGTKMWNERYAPKFTPRPHLTYMTEIVYPANRIVVNYGNMSELVLLGATVTATGEYIPPTDIAGWPGPVTQTFPYTTYREALSAPPRSGKEGYVIYIPRLRERVKIKQEDYLRLHALVTNTNEKTVWEALQAGTPLSTTLSDVPDEFHTYVKDTERSLLNQHARFMVTLNEEYHRIVASLPTNWTRKDFAVAVSRHPHKSALFLLASGEQPTRYAWGQLRPTTSPLSGFAATSA